MADTQSKAHGAASASLSMAGRGPPQDETHPPARPSPTALPPARRTKLGSQASYAKGGEDPKGGKPCYAHHLPSPGGESYPPLEGRGECGGRGASLSSDGDAAAWPALSYNRLKAVYGAATPSLSEAGAVAGE